jgi:hypothetical protein
VYFEKTKKEIEKLENEVIAYAQKNGDLAMTQALLEESRKTISLNHRNKITGGDVL